MATQVQLRRGTEAENNEFTGAEGEITIDTTNDTIRVHDGIKKGGYRVMKGNDPIVPSTNAVITYDKKGLVTGGRALNYNDLAGAKLEEKFPVKPTNSPAGTFTKVKVNSFGQIESGESLSESDVPTLPISKTEGLKSSLDNKAEKISVVEKTGVSGTVNLVEGKLNIVQVVASTTLQPPIITQDDLGILRQLIVQLDNTNGVTVTVSGIKNTFGSSGETSFEIRDSGYYNIYFEYNVRQNGWIAGIIKV